MSSEAELALPSRPNLEHLHKQAKELLRDLRGGNDDAFALLRKHHPAYAEKTKTQPVLADAQLVTARRYGFASWSHLKNQVELLNMEFSQWVERFVRAATVSHAGGNDSWFHQAKEMLEYEPTLADANIYTALVLGKVDAIERALQDDPDLVNRKNGPRDWQPLLYVTYSKFHREKPAIAEGLLHIAKRLLDLGADPDVSFTVEPWADSPLRPLYGACGVANFSEMVNLLLDHGATINDFESLYHSLEHPDTRCLELLLEKGADPTRTNALNHSFDFAGIERTRLLLEHGADPNEIYQHIGTSLHFAIQRKRPQATLELLVKHGANINTRRYDGRSCYQLALQYAYREAAEYLEHLGADLEATPLQRFFAACGNGDRSVANTILVENPKLLDTLSVTDQSIFLDLSEQGNALAVGTLLERGFPISVLASEGETALHRACWHGQYEVVKVLLEHNAPLEIVENSFGCTPLGWAAHGCDNWPNPDGDYPAVVQALLEADADITATNKWGETLIDLAGSHQVVVDLLRRYGVQDNDAEKS